MLTCLFFILISLFLFNFKIDSIVFPVVLAETTEEMEWKDTEPLNQLTESDVSLMIGDIINIILGFIGSIGLVMFVYAGILWMMSAGNSEAQKKAINILIWSSLGILVILFSYIIVRFVLEAFK